MTAGSISSMQNSETSQSQQVVQYVQSEAQGEHYTLTEIPTEQYTEQYSLVPEDSAMVASGEGDLPAQQPLGELFVDPTCPESLAPWLLLLDANALFVIHMTGPETSYRTMANPQGKIPTWIDADGSCMWESNAVMRYVCLKHRLDPQFYATNNLGLRTRTDMALDWCTTVLFPHLKQVVDPTGYERSDNTDLPTAKLYLDMDFKILTEYFLKETQFIGGELPNIADYAIGMQCLMLFATDYPLADTVRSYLYNIAENSENWNEVTGTLRDHCTAMQAEHRAFEIDAEKIKREEAARRREEEDARYIAQAEEQRLIEEESWKRSMEDQKQAWEAEYQARKDEEDRRYKAEWDQKVGMEDERRRAEEASFRNRTSGDSEQREENRRALDQEQRLYAQFQDRKSVQEAELEKLEAAHAEWEEQKRQAEEAAAATAQATKKATKKTKGSTKTGVRKAAPR